MIQPYLRVVPAALGNRLEEALLVAGELGLDLDAEQKLCLADLTATDGDDKLVAYEGAISAPRQSGKTVVGEVLAVMYAQRGESVLFTGHRADLAGVIFRRLVANIPEAWGTTAIYSNGREQVEFESGGRIVFKTRSQRVGRGDSFDKLLVDEGQLLAKDDLDGAKYALRARPEPQVLFLGMAPNGRANINCLVWKDLRDRAQSGRSERLVYLEWSGVVRDEDGDELQAHQMTWEMLSDPRLWRRATPNYGARITEEKMESELESAQQNPETFAVEALNIPLWPDIAYAGTGPVTTAGWDSLVDEDSQLEAEEIPQAVLGFDMSRERDVAVELAGLRQDELLHLDHVGSFNGIPAAAEAITKILERSDLDVRAVVCDGSPDNLGLLKRLKADYAVSEHQLREEGAARLGQQACGGLVDLVSERRFRHRGQRELHDAVAGAVTKPVGDGWVYSRSKSRSNVAPLIAGAVALHVADLELKPAEAGALQVF